jgi:hypothetical protein
MGPPREQLKVFPFQAGDGTFHIVPTTSSRPKRGREPTLCGLDTTFMRKSAPFAPDDPRGRVHFERGCDECIDKLSRLEV